MRSSAEKIPELAGIPWVATDEVETREAADWLEPRTYEDTPAFLQYTSGSTGMPKGVAVTHGNLLHNEALIGEAFEQSEHSVVVGWLPLYHDMGLIGNVLQPLYQGARCVLMSPMAFLYRPLRWLEAVSRYRATTSGGPDFAYELCVRRIGPEDLQGLDLSCWKVAYNGSEPVRAETLERFASAFAASGFRREAFYPCYGLAESTLFVSGGTMAAGPVVRDFDAEALEGAEAVAAAPASEARRGVRTLVGCGHCRPGHEVAIVDPSTLKRAASGRIGEIWVRGPSVAAGYWGRSDASAETFGARLADEPAAGPFLRTGDLGFLADGELFVTGRSKDLIIVRGRNIHPHDVELAAEQSHPCLRPGCGAAFSIDAGEELLVLVLEVEPRARPEVGEVAEVVRQAVAQALEVRLHDVVLAKAGAVPRTSSGKVRRRACREAYRAGELATWGHDLRAAPGDVAESEEELSRDVVLAVPVEDRPALVRSYLERRLVVLLAPPAGRVEPERPLTGQGLDSLRAMELRALLERDLGCLLPATALVEGVSLAQLTGDVVAALESSRAQEPLVAVGETTGRHPVSRGQAALWFLHRMAPHASAYNVAVAARPRGPLDEGALARSLERLAERHPALRTRFPDPGGEVVQEVSADAGAIDFVSEDAAGWDEARLQERLGDEAHRPFDLERGPLVRVLVLRRSPEEHVFLSVVHHIVTDFWSLAVIFDELGRIYAAETADRPVALEDVKLRYTDFVRFQEEMLAGPEGERLETWWLARLAGELPPLELPCDRPRPPVPSWRGGARHARLPPPAAQALRALGEAAGATLFTTLLAAFQACLHRYTGQRDLLVGSPISGRSRPELAGVVGYFVHPLVLRTEIRGNPSFASLLAVVRRGTLEALRHQDYPFERLVERLHPERGTSRTPLFQAMFSLLRTPPVGSVGLEAFALGRGGGRVVVGGLEWESIELAERAAAFDLSLAAAPLEDGLGLRLQFSRDLFEEVTAERMLAHFMRLASDAAEQSERPLSHLRLLSPAEGVQLLEWNGTRTPRPRAECLHDLVEDRATQVPDAVAVESCDVGALRLTYGELVSRGDRLAGRLRSLGAAPESLVAVAMGRSPEMVVALLAVGKAGAAWVPLDPTYPEERLRFTLEDAFQRQDRRLLLTRRADLEHLPSLEGLGVRAVTVDATRSGGELAGPPPEARRLAYVIYTSGSTGRPKGVAIPHRAAVNFLDSMRRVPGLGAGDVFLAVTTLAFDIALLELFLPLAVGARVVVASRRVAADGRELSRELERRGVTGMQATPATWELLLEAGWTPPPKLVALCGGESLPAALAGRLRGGGRLWNMYGPTETTVWSAVREPGGGEDPVRFGGAIANTRLHLVGRHFELVPVGVHGEVLIGGDGLARGYLHRPALTAERFVPDPFEDAAAGDRLYRVGDLARRRSDGTLEFLGRVDHQVKVRGHRIELGEIEVVLAKQPAVRQAVVLARGHGPEARLTAYLTVEGGASPAVDELREALRRDLPESMIPTAWVTLERWPLTPNGKIDRRALPAPSPGRPAGPESGRTPRGRLERTLAELWCEVLEVESVAADDNFFDLGGHSLLVARLQRRLSERLGRDDLTVVDLFRHPTVGSLARFLAPEPSAAPRPVAAWRRRRTGATDGVAVVGMAGRFPGAPDVDAFWENLAAGVESISWFSDRELSGHVAPHLLADERYVRARGVVEGAETFDAAFFGYTPREAEVMDPQHRLFLECSWEALENAGYDSARYPGKIALYAGVGMNSYLLYVGEERLARAAGSYQAFVANDKDFVPTRASYKLGLRGPSVNVQTACSSSLVALHLACRGLAAGEADMALAGGVSVRVPQRQGYLFEAGGILSSDGHCRPFDVGAGGTVLGNGLAVVALKPLAAALEDGDTVLAVVKGSSVNNDGALKMGYTAPSVEGQAEVIADALDAAGVAPESVSYVETHGTGTETGDPIEVAALGRIYGTEARRGSCVLGAVKANIGHLDTAAGIAGLVKTVLALRHGRIPPSVHFTSPNPGVPFDAGPFHVNRELAEWRADGTPRRAGVSSFGIGGTNVHVVLEEAPALPAVSEARRARLVVLSAKTPSALEDATGRLVRHLRASEDDLAEVAYTLQVGRRAFAHRRWLVAHDREDAAAALESLDPERVRTASTGSAAPGSLRESEAWVVFMFSGQGSQHAGMGRWLYDNEPVFRSEVDRGASWLEEHCGLDLRRSMDSDGAEPASELGQTRITQPALFVVEHALARLWGAWGVRPAAMLGHSVGEWVAATLAGVFSYEEALGLVAERGRLMQDLPPGSMLAVGLAEAAVRPLLGAELSLAAINGPAEVVVAGPSPEVEALRAELERGEVRCRRLHTSHAFHSKMMAPAAAAFVRAIEKLRPAAPRIPFVSNVTGTWITDAEATDPLYWGRHVAEPVRFADGLATLGRDGGVFLEVGPGRALATLARAQMQGRTVLATLPHPREAEAEEVTVLGALGRLWQAGAPIDWEGFYASRSERRRRVPLPTYPFERRRFWLEPEREAGAPEARGAGSGAPAKKPDVGAWFYAPVWKQSFPGGPATPARAETWLVLSGPENEGAGARLARRMSAVRRVSTVLPGGGFARLGPGTFTVDPARHEDFVRVLESLGETPDHVVHAWAADLAPERRRAPLAAGPEPGFAGLLPLVRALAAREDGAGSRLSVLTERSQKIESSDIVEPFGATLPGLLEVVAQELPGLACRAIDVDRGTSVEDLAEDLSAPPEVPGEPGAASVVGWRGGQRWTRTFEPVRLFPGSERLSPDGAWLVTGGLGGVGLALGRALAELMPGTPLVLLGRRGLPPRETWEDWLGRHGDDEATSRRILGVRRLEAAGSEVLSVAADVADREALAAAVAAARARFGPLRGVIHAAGVPGGGLLRTRTIEESAAVLRPKTDGTRNLLEVLTGDPPDLVLLCSSINSVVGGFGQGDYAAANAYLDAVAASGARGGPRIVSLGWDRWRGVGMAAGARSHPLLGELVTSSPVREVYRGLFAVESHWVLAEHQVAGRPTVPGAAYLEMARAAFAGRRSERGCLEIADVAFLEPLAVDPGSRRVVATELDFAEGESPARFRILSRSSGAQAWKEHCRGRVSAVEEAPRPAYDLGEIAARCPETVTAADVAARSSRGFLVTGRRWQGIERVRFGGEEMLVTLTLADELAPDLESFELHPALLDIAVGSAQFLRDGDYLPLAYERLRIHGPLPRRLSSHLTLRSSGDDTLSCDAALLDEAGLPRVTVQGFSMKRIGTAALASLEAAAPPPDRDERPSAEEVVLEGTLEADEATEVLRRVLSAQRLPPHLVISPRGFDAVRDAYRRFDPAAAVAPPSAPEAPSSSHARPDLGTAYVAPGEGLEKVIAETWRRYLGIEEVGIHDNFFELGGTSLLGVQVVGELERRLRREISTVSLFEAPTIAALSKYLAPPAGDGPAFAQTRDRVSKKKAALERQQRARGGRRRR